MLSVGTFAPTFDGSAVVAQEIVEQDWDEIHEKNVLILLFDSLEDDAGMLDDLAALTAAAAAFERLESKVAVVCRDDAYETLARLDRVSDEDPSAATAIPILIDSDQRIASLYDMVFSDGRVLWGHCIIDSIGIVRQFTQSSIRTKVNVNELIRCVEAIVRPYSDWPC